MCIRDSLPAAEFGEEKIPTTIVNETREDVKVEPTPIEGEEMSPSPLTLSILQPEESKMEQGDPLETVKAELKNQTVESLKGLFRCYNFGHCVCGKCPWPLGVTRDKRHPGLASLYRSDFTAKPMPTQTPTPVSKMTSLSLTRTSANEPPASTVMKTDFRPWERVLTKSAKPEDFKFESPLIGRSAYKASFIDFKGGVSSLRERHVEPISILSDLPFFKGDSSYKETFLPRLQTKEALLKPTDHAIFQSPLVRTLPYVRESAYQTAYKPKLADSQRGRSLESPAISKANSVPSFPGQFISVSGKSFPHTNGAELSSDNRKLAVSYTHLTLPTIYSV
eukprot:TRINITY_DN12956_c0_g2_i2.p1 TRINITY_DN12956_c0_g2~~TRINITY_DN12956_c0_g2_i2.p1  ORF type:complete len:355 (-),score=72.57 TRINITY_DN12956_c0_g2_i2:35-1042(-)